MIIDLVGITALLFLALCVTICSLRWPAVTNILWAAFVIRVCALLFHLYISPLPDSDGDAIDFERRAWELAQNGFMDAFSNLELNNAYFISSIISLFYTATDRSLLLAHSLSVLMGTGTVLLGWLLFRELWGDRIATKGAWLLVFLPSLVLYSALILRESYITLFLTFGLLGAVHWIRTSRLRSLLLAIFGFAVATLFHGAMFIGLIIFFVIIFWQSLKKIFVGFKRSKLCVTSLILLLSTLIVLVFFLSGKLNINKIRNTNLLYFERFYSAASLSTRSSGGNQDGASYPIWTVPNSFFELTYKMPVRSIYFLFSPFPWDVRKLSHIIGLFDGLMYIVLVFFLFYNRKAIWADPAARFILLALLVYLLLFGLGVGNFGTALRHRSKFVVMIIAMAAPYLPRLVWQSKHKTSLQILADKNSKISSEKKKL
jgi:4-amino-4-deoxy-L-arabinose transferase-like glycosyltransferase